MFILTQDLKIINTNAICMIRQEYNSIIAYTVETRCCLAEYETRRECELAFDTLTETLKTRKELYDLSE